MEAIHKGKNLLPELAPYGSIFFPEKQKNSPYEQGNYLFRSKPF